MPHYVDFSDFVSHSQTPFTVQRRADGCTYWQHKGNFHRTDGPAAVLSNGDQQWWIDGKRHRIDGPAIEYADGSKEWRFHDKLHRVDGPAIEYANGIREWWLHGKSFPRKSTLTTSKSN